MIRMPTMVAVRTSQIPENKECVFIKALFVSTKPGQRDFFSPWTKHPVDDQRRTLVINVEMNRISTYKAGMDSVS